LQIIVRVSIPHYVWIVGVGRIVDILPLLEKQLPFSLLLYPLFFNRFEILACVIGVLDGILSQSLSFSLPQILVEP